MENENLNNIRSRPRYKLETDLSPKEVEQYFLDYVRTHKNIFGKVNHEVITIWANTDDHNYWKPFVSIRIEKANEKEDRLHTVINSLVGPSAAVWTFFMFLYFIFGILFMVFISLWYVEIQIKTDNYPWALPAAILCLVLVLGTWLATQIGKRLAKKDMEILHNFGRDAILPLQKKEKP